jgi:hypothetical protein
MPVVQKTFQGFWLVLSSTPMLPLPPFTVNEPLSTLEAMAMEEEADETANKKSTSKTTPRNSKWVTKLN